MEENKKPSMCTHHGRNVEFWRAFNNLSQEALAALLGMSQVRISQLEKQEVIDDKTLELIAEKLEVSVNQLKQCDHKGTLKTCKHIINYIVSSGATVTNFGENDIDSHNTSHTINNPLEKVSELYERILSLTEENATLKSEIKRLKGE